MFNNLKLILILSSILIYNCGGNESKSRLPLSTKSIEASDLYHEAIYLNNIYMGDKAKVKLEEAVNLDPDFGAAFLMLSTFGSNSVSETDNYYEKALSLKDKMNDVEKCFLDIRSSYRNDDIETRVEASKRLIDLIPENAIAHERMAYTQYEMANIEEVRKSALKAIDFDKYYSPAYTILVNSYTFTEPKSFDKAEKFAKQVLAFNKDRSFYHVMLGDVYRAQNKLEEAAKKYDDAYNTGTNNWLSAAKAGHAYTMFNPEEARKRFDQAVNEARTDNQKIGPEQAKIYTHLHQNNFQKALAQVELIKTSLSNYDFSDQEIQSQMSGLLWHEYFIHSHSGQYALAKNALKEKRRIDIALAKLSKNELSVYNTESTLLWLDSHLEIMKGNYEVAKNKLSDLYSRVKTTSDPKRFDGYNNLMGMANLMSGNAKKSIEHFEAVVEQENIYFQYFKGLSYKADGKLDAAKETFKYVATYNFNGLIYTMVRNKAIEEIAKG